MSRVCEGDAGLNSPMNPVNMVQPTDDILLKRPWRNGGKEEAYQSLARVREIQRVAAGLQSPVSVLVTPDTCGAINIITSGKGFESRGAQYVAQLEERFSNRSTTELDNLPRLPTGKLKLKTKRRHSKSADSSPPSRLPTISVNGVNVPANQQNGNSNKPSNDPPANHVAAQMRESSGGETNNQAPAVEQRVSGSPKKMKNASNKKIENPQVSPRINHGGVQLSPKILKIFTSLPNSGGQNPAINPQDAALPVSNGVQSPKLNQSEQLNSVSNFQSVISTQCDSQTSRYSSDSQTNSIFSSGSQPNNLHNIGNQPNSIHNIGNQPNSIHNLGNQPNSLNNFGHQLNSSHFLGSQTNSIYGMFLQSNGIKSVDRQAHQLMHPAKQNSSIQGGHRTVNFAEHNQYKIIQNREELQKSYLDLNDGAAPPLREQPTQQTQRDYTASDAESANKPTENLLMNAQKELEILLQGCDDVCSISPELLSTSSLVTLKLVSNITQQRIDSFSGEVEGVESGDPTENITIWDRVERRKEKELKLLKLYPLSRLVEDMWRMRELYVVPGGITVINKDIQQRIKKVLLHLHSTDLLLAERHLSTNLSLINKEILDMKRQRARRTEDAEDGQDSEVARTQDQLYKLEFRLKEIHEEVEDLGSSLSLYEHELLILRQDLQKAAQLSMIKPGGEVCPCPTSEQVLAVENGLKQVQKRAVSLHAKRHDILQSISLMKKSPSFDDFDYYLEQCDLSLTSLGSRSPMIEPGQSRSSHSLNVWEPSLPTSPSAGLTSPMLQKPVFSNLRPASPRMNQDPNKVNKTLTNQQSSNQSPRKDRVLKPSDIKKLKKSQANGGNQTLSALSSSNSCNNQINPVKTGFNQAHPALGGPSSSTGPMTAALSQHSTQQTISASPAHIHSVQTSTVSSVQKELVLPFSGRLEVQQLNPASETNPILPGHSPVISDSFHVFSSQTPFGNLENKPIGRLDGWFDSQPSDSRGQNETRRNVPDPPLEVKVNIENKTASRSTSGPSLPTSTAPSLLLPAQVDRLSGQADRLSGQFLPSQLDRPSSAASSVSNQSEEEMIALIDQLTNQMFDSDPTAQSQGRSNSLPRLQRPGSGADPILRPSSAILNPHRFSSLNKPEQGRPSAYQRLFGKDNMSMKDFQSMNSNSLPRRKVPVFVHKVSRRQEKTGERSCIQNLQSKYNLSTGAINRTAESPVSDLCPDYVRSTPTTRKLDSNSIEKMIGAPDKIVIPDRYVPEKEEKLGDEERRKKMEKVESLKRMLGSDQTFTLNQMIAKQVMQKSRKLAEEAASRRSAAQPEVDEDENSDSSPDVPLPLRQQRESFLL